MSNPAFALTVLTLVAVGLADVAPSQGRGRRGPPPEVKERWGNYFTTVKLPAAQDLDGESRLAATDHVQAAAAAGNLSLLYLYDSNADPKRLPGFEQALFNNNKINPGLRLFACGRIDIADDDAAMKNYGKKVPTFVVFDKAGKEVTQVSLGGFSAVPEKLVQVLRRGAKGHGKLSFDAFVKRYGKFLRELGLLAGRKRTFESQRKRLESKPAGTAKKQLAKIEKKESALQKETGKHLGKEAKLLELAKVPERHPDAKLVGEPRRGGR